MSENLEEQLQADGQQAESFLEKAVDKVKEFVEEVKKEAEEGFEKVEGFFEGKDAEEDVAPDSEVVPAEPVANVPQEIPTCPSPDTAAEPAEKPIEPATEVGGTPLA